MVSWNQRREEKVDKLNQDEDVINFLNTREDWEKLDRAVRRDEMKRAISESVEKNTQQTKLETAKKMIKKSIDIKTVQEITGLSKETLSFFKIY